MVSRLIAEKHIKIDYLEKGQFSIGKNTLAYCIESQIVIKCLFRQIQAHIFIDFPIICFQISQQEEYLIVLTQKCLTIYELEISNNIIKWKIALQIKGVLQFQQIRGGLVVMLQKHVIKYFQYSCLGVSNTICQCQSLSRLLKCMSDTILIRTNQTIIAFNRYNNIQFQKSARISLREDPIATYKNRYLFFQIEKNVQIYDISEKKWIGKFPIEGKLKSCSIKGDMMLLIINMDTTDYYWFYVFSSKSNIDENLITNRVCYKKVMGDFIQFINIQKEQYATFIRNNNEQSLIYHQLPVQVSENTISVVFVHYRKKQKIQIIKVPHSKIISQKYCQQKLNKQINSEIQNKTTEQQVLEIDKARIQYYIQHNHAKQKNNLETQTDNLLQQKLVEIQIKYIQSIIQAKLNTVMQRFSELEKRLQNLQNIIKSIYSKIQQSIQSINKLDIKKNVKNLFNELTPQFSEYFNQVFKQVSCFMEQGLAYYNYKLIKEADIHRQVLSKIINLSFKTTEDMIELTSKEFKLSTQTEKHLKQLANLKKSWCQQTKNYEVKIKQMKQSSFVKPSAKISRKLQTLNTRFNQLETRKLQTLNTRFNQLEKTDKD